jgi:hypothetical protein
MYLVYAAVSALAALGAVWLGQNLPDPRHR